jgi:WD40 repeat protein/predicted Ser/Thr protein kinase
VSDTTSARILEVFDEASQLRGEDRSRYLDTACGDDEQLRAEVQSLLLHADAGDSPVDERLDALAPDALAAVASSATSRTRFAPDERQESGEQLPETLGRFRIVRRIATGGMGTVYEAVQSNPARRVALKTMRSELITSTLRGRFQREAEILGRLQHPCIGQIHEAGTVEHLGRELPYFAMEYVDGQPLGDYAADAGLGERERLTLFAQICDAVHHAHGEGIVHRDLKPDNILVTADGLPKILDFGVARITASDVAAPTLATEVGQIMGTLPYMSPEQVLGKPDAIDARSDVYALGVVLFELLTGRRPHDLSHRTLPEAARIIREQDATRLGSVATRWRGDLETIVGKALEKERSRRYTGADELAADVRRHLSDQPIAARAPSRLYLARKFVRRHTGLVVGLLIAFVALAAGLVISLAFAFDEAEQRRASDFAGYRAVLAAAGAALDDGERETAKALLDDAPEDLRGWEWRHAVARADPLLWEVERDVSMKRRDDVNSLNSADRLRHPSNRMIASFGLDEQRVAALVARDRVDVFATESGARLHGLVLSAEPIPGGLVATSSGFLTASRDGRIAHWDGETGALLAEEILEAGIQAIAWDDFHGRLAVAGGSAWAEGSTLLVGRLGALRPIETAVPKPLPIGWTDAGRTLVINSLMLSGSTAEHRCSLLTLPPDDAADDPPSQRHGAQVSDVFDVQGDRLLARPFHGRSTDVVVVDREGTELLSLDRPEHAAVFGAAFSRDGRRIVTTNGTSITKIVTVFDAASGRAITRWHLGATGSGVLSPTGRRLLLGTEARLSVLSLESPATAVLPGAGDYVYDVAWSPDGRTLWTRSFDLQMRGYDVVEGSVILDLPSTDPLGLINNSDGYAPFRRIWGLSVDARRIVSSDYRGPFPEDARLTGSRLFSATNLARRGFLTFDLASGDRWTEGPGEAWERLRDDPAPEVIEAMRQPVLNLLTDLGVVGTSDVPPEHFTVARRNGSHPRLLVDPTGRLLVGPFATFVEHLDGTGRVPLQVDGRELDLFTILPGDDLSVWPRVAMLSDVSFSPDGRLLAAVRPGVHDGALVHDAATGAAVVELLAGLDADDVYYAVAFSPDGRRLAVAGTDRVVSLFDTTTWELMTRLEGHTAYIMDIDWSPDGETLATASGDGTVRLWTTRPPSERSAAAHASAARREHQRPAVAALFEELDDPRAVEDAVWADASLDADDRHAALRVVRELADAWWAARADEVEGGGR